MNEKSINQGTVDVETKKIEFTIHDSKCQPVDAVVMGSKTMSNSLAQLLQGIFSNYLS